MNKKNFYLFIIAVLIIYLIIIIATSINNVYVNALNIEQVVDKTEEQVSRASRVLCEPIIELRRIGPSSFLSFPIGTPEGVQFCEEIE